MRKEPTDSVARAPPHDDGSSSCSSESDDDELGLAGVLIRNPDVSSSSSDESDAEDERKPPAKKLKAGKDLPPEQNEVDSATSTKRRKKNKKKKRERTNEPEMIQVEFTFHDMNEKFYHGIKTLLHSSSPIYVKHSTDAADVMIDNVSVGTVISTEGDTEHNVYGFASILNVTTYQEKPCIQYWKQLCLENCPSDRKQELEVVLGGKTNRPAGFLLHSRMVNLPLELVEVLHQQLILDVDWAVKSAEGGEAERKSLDFGVIVRLAPATSTGHTVDYKYFDDEVLASSAEFVFAFDAPKTARRSDTNVKDLVTAIVLTKIGHRNAMDELAKLVKG